MAHTVTTLELPLVPESFNRTRYAPWYVTRAANSALQGALGAVLMASGVPRGQSSVYASAELTFPTKRRRDEGNYRTPLEKALGDVLVSGRWLSDDTPDHYRFGGVVFSSTAGPHNTVLTLRWNE